MYLHIVHPTELILSSPFLSIVEGTSLRTLGDDVTDIRGSISQSETLCKVTQMQRLEVEDLLELARVGCVRTHEALEG